MGKKLLAIVMSLTMMLTFMPAMAFADEPAGDTGIEIASIAFTAKEQKIVYNYELEDEYEMEEGCYFYGPEFIEGDSIAITYKDGTSVTYIFTEGDDDMIWVNESDPDDVISMEDISISSARIPDDAADGAYFDFEIEYRGVTTTGTVVFKSSNVSDITFTTKSDTITLYKGVDEITDDGGDTIFDVGNVYEYLSRFNNDTVTIVYNDGTASETFPLDEFENWTFVTENNNGEYVSLSEAQQETAWEVGNSYYIFLKAKGKIDITNKITVTVEANPFDNASFSFTQSGEYLYVFEEEGPDYDSIAEEYVLDADNTDGYYGSEGDILSFTLADGSKVVFEYGRITDDPNYPNGWDGLVTTDASGKKSRPQREIKFKDNTLRWTKGSDGRYINNSAKLTYMGADSTEPLVSYVGNQVWFDSNGGNVNANFAVPIGMSVNDMLKIMPQDFAAGMQPSKSGYTFVGWYEKDPNTGKLNSTPFDFDKKIEEETFLFAKWEEASAADLDDAKTTAKAELDSYKDAAAYREAQRTELANAIAAGKEAIDAAEDIEGVDAALAEAKASIDKIKTDAELTAEEAAEAARIEQARQGTPEKAIPKVKISKPKAAKKAVTVKWKKLSKKQLKKSKATEYEIWVCPNKSFGPNDTVIRTAGKKKARLKIRGLKKGTYYLKVRAVRYDNNIKKVGKWSSVRKVKIKK